MNYVSTVNVYHIHCSLPKLASVFAVLYLHEILLNLEALLLKSALLYIIRSLFAASLIVRKCSKFVKDSVCRMFKKDS